MLIAVPFHRNGRAVSWSCRFIGVTAMRGVILITVTLALVTSALPGVAQPRAVDPKRSTVTVRVFKSGLFRALPMTT